MFNIKGIPSGIFDKAFKFIHNIFFAIYKWFLMYMTEKIIKIYKLETTLLATFLFSIYKSLF
jgi:hypothetical protein